VTYNIGGPVHAEHHGTRPVADAPDKYVLHPCHHILLEDLVPHDPGEVGLTRVLIGRVYPILDGLQHVTPGFKGKPECINTCAPGSSFTHVLTQ
jgi:hypothetical protein